MRIFSTPRPSVMESRTQVMRYEPTAGQVFGAAALESVRDTSLVLAAEGADLMMGRYSGDPIDEQEWRESRYFREGLKWRPGMTADEAFLNARRHDMRSRNQFILSRSKGASHTAAQLGGALFGGLPDPLNFIPILGPSARARIAGRIGRVLGAGAVASGEAGLAVAALQPAVAARNLAQQENYDLTMAAENVGIAMLIGFAFGASSDAMGLGFKAIRHKAARRPPQENVAAVGKAVSDMMDGRPVDVSPVLPERADIFEAMRLEIDNPARLGEGGPPVELRESMTPAERARAYIEIERKSPELRTNEERVFLDRIDPLPEYARAIGIEGIPPAKRTKEQQAFMGAFKEGGDTLTTHYQGEIKRLEGRLKKAREKVETVNGEKSPAAKKIRADEREIRAELAHLKDRIVELQEGLPESRAIAHEPEPDFPEVEPTTPRNEGLFDELDEAEIAAVDTEFEQMKATGEIPEDDLRQLELDDADAKRAEAQEPAWIDAAHCVLRNS